MSIMTLPVTTIDGKSTTLADYRGKVLLIVNTASRCGYTPQYQDLEAIHQRFRDRGFMVLGFPSNDFGAQEPGSNEEIQNFCELKYHVKFPLFAKIPVLGEAKHPLYKELIAQSTNHDEVKWNFEKFLVSGEGKVLGRFKSAVKPTDPQLTQAIENALTKK